MHTPLLMTTIIRYGYYDGRIDESLNGNQATNEAVAKIIHDAFIHSVNSFLNEEDEIGNVNIGRSQFREGKIFSTTALSYSTAAKMRQPSLRQDEEVLGAVSEVLSFNYRLTHQPTTIGRWTEYAKSYNVQEHMQMWLDKECNSLHIKMHHMDSLVPRSSKFYAERSATQRSYTFLLPVTWILPATKDEATNTCACARRSDSISQIIEWGNNLSQRSLQQHRIHEPRAAQTKLDSPECILALKRSLKSIESETVPNRRVRRHKERDKDNDDGALTGDTEDEMLTSYTPTRLSHGRFGQLWRKEKKCWSNFTSLTGMASSPGYEAVWRTMDRAKIVGVIDVNGNIDIDSMEDTIQGIHIIIEFKADGFVVGEIPRIISAVVAMTNGWLPANFFDISTRPEVYLPPPTPPPSLQQLCYFQSARYHFHELSSNTHGGSFARVINAGSQSELEWEEHLKKMFLSCAASSVSKRMKNEWLSDLCNVVSPDLRRRVESFEAEHLEHHSQEIVHGTSSILPLVLADAPVGDYSDTLALLRDVVQKGLWPATSEARSRVIKSPSGSSGNILATKKRTIASCFPGNTISSGSFTVINEQICKFHNLPLGNSLFSPLRKAVFELEEEIIRKNFPITAADGMSLSSLRRPSTHCAVNRNAQFTPHVDSGRGQGQSVSLIVGLGNYTGGDVLVEGQSYDIRYNPLEFDGWNQLHWTSPFQGERYSLVFFTPEVSTKVGRQGDGSLIAGDDDYLHSNRLAQEHSKNVAFLSPLVFRPESTDAIVINELLDPIKGSIYSLKHHLAPTMPSGFSLAEHDSVLDVGAHIGVFSRLALAEGCSRVIAYEPESTNIELLRQNLKFVSPMAFSSSSLPMIELHTAAVTNGSSKSRTLVRARNENSGKLNTWRHSLEEYTQYVDRTTELPSVLQKKILDRCLVDCVPFFCSGEGKQNGALVPGITFVKLDCEGAEIEILLSEDAALRSSWLECTHLVFEWSFTKERRVDVFHKAVGNLERAGFELHYEGKGSWWDTDTGTLWPYPNDVIIFAAMKQ